MVSRRYILLTLVIPELFIFSKLGFWNSYLFDEINWKLKSCIAMTCHADVHCPLRINPTDFHVFLTFPLEPPAQQIFSGSNDVSRYLLLWIVRTFCRPTEIHGSEEVYLNRYLRLILVFFSNVSQQLLDGLPRSLVQTLMSPLWCILATLATT